MIVPIGNWPFSPPSPRPPSTETAAVCPLISCVSTRLSRKFCSRKYVVAPETTRINATSATTPRTRRPLSERVTSLLSARRAEDVTDAAHRLHEWRLEAVDLAPQIADVGLEHARVAAEVVVPYVVE